jgi:biotin operon repressor
MDRTKGEVRPAAYIRRIIDTDGLSVEPASTVSVEEVGSRLNKCYGAVSLHVGHVRDLGLDIQQDGPTHANIVGVPYQEQDAAESERIAGLLARQSRIQRLV